MRLGVKCVQLLWLFLHLAVCDEQLGTCQPVSAVYNVDCYADKLYIIGSFQSYLTENWIQGSTSALL